MRTAIVWLGVLAGCGARGSEPPLSGRAAARSGAPLLPGTGERAYIGGDGLVEVAADSGVHQTLAPGPVAWCAADARANVVWFVEESGLSVFDLADRTVHPVIRADFANIDPIIEYPDARLGGTDPVELRVGAKLVMAARPRVTLEMGCDGDAAYYCYESDLTTPQPEIARDQATVKAMVLADPPYVTSLVDRGVKPTPPPSSPRTPPAPPHVDPAPCTEDPGMCGQLAAVPGTSLWLVTVANARGDFYHEARQLWDPATGDFLRIASGTLLRERTPTTDPEGWDDFSGLQISPRGVLANHGDVFTERAVVFHTDAGIPHACGWGHGGWRLGR